MEVYRSKMMAVRRVASADLSRWVVTFDHHSIGGGLDRPGFGEDFFRDRGISAVHILGRGDDWYQYPDVLFAAAAARTAMAGAVRRVAYGSSMGGYAALRLADAVGADAVLACSPQYSNDPVVVPWETRWAAEGRRIAWRRELGGPIRCGCTPVLVLDPHGPDLRHARLIEGDLPCTIIPVPRGGHPVTTFLSEIGMLGGLVLDMIDDRLDPAAATAEIRMRRRRSTHYLGALAEAQPVWRLQSAIAIARTAAEQGGIAGMLSLARLLSRAGRHDEALPLYHAVVTRSGRKPNYLVPYGDALLAVGDVPAAAIVATEAVAALPEAAHLHHWQAWMLDAIRDHVGAYRAERAAVRLDPGNAPFRAALKRYRSRFFRQRLAELIGRRRRAAR